MDSDAIVLLSGGLDSATCLAVASAAGHRVHAMSFRYGQHHDVELAAAARVVASAAVADRPVVEHRVVEIDLAAFGGSSLTGDGDIPKDRGDRIGDGIPSTYVPARNTVFLSYALAWSEVLDADAIYIGVNALDYSGYPDCRPAFIEAFQAVADTGTRRGSEGRPVRIETPLLHLTKAAIVGLGVDLGVDHAVTVSCYDPDPADGAACGACDACVLRRDGFAAAGVDDPTRYR